MLDNKHLNIYKNVEFGLDGNKRHIYYDAQYYNI